MTQCQTELSTMRLTKNYPEGALKFFQQFKITYFDLDHATQTVVSNKEKIGQLNATLRYYRFQHALTTYKALELNTGNPLNYLNYLKSMITHSENLRNSTRNNKSMETISGDRL